MSIWSIMNGAAWVLSAALLARIAWDFIGVERARRAKDGEADARKDDER